MENEKTPESIKTIEAWRKAIFEKNGKQIENKQKQISEKVTPASLAKKSLERLNDN